MSTSAALSAPPSGGTRVPRHKVFLPAEMIDVAGTTRVHLLNLSLTGALAHGGPVPAPGAIVQMRCGDTHWLARIVWAQDKRFGVAHVVPLSTSTVGRLVGGAA